MAITPIIPPGAGAARAQENSSGRATEAVPSAVTSSRGAAAQVDERTLAVAETVRQNQEAARSTVAERELTPAAETRADTVAVERQSTSAAAAQTNFLPSNVLRLVNE
jgi:hypothetical protein